MTSVRTAAGPLRRSSRTPSIAVDNAAMRSLFAIGAALAAGAPFGGPAGKVITLPLGGSGGEIRSLALRGFLSALLLGTVVLALACCARAEPEAEAAKAAAELAAARDPATASSVVSGVAARGCPGLRSAVEALDRSRTSGRLLSGLVDDAVARAAAACAGQAALAALAGPRAPAFQLARARLLAARPAQALAELAATSSEPAVRLRRAELLAALDRPAEALPELDAYLASAPGDGRARAARVEGLLAVGRTADALALSRGDAAGGEARIAALAAAGRLDEVAAGVSAAPLPERPALARRAAALLPAAALAREVAPGHRSTRAPAELDVELLTALADRVESERGGAAAVALRERAARAAPARAELADALARALAADRRIDEAVSAWDRAAAAAPAAPAYRLAPVRALAAAGHEDRARNRARTLVASARRTRAAADLVTASAAAALAGDADLAARVAREARAARPGDGRLAMLVGERLAEAGDREGAAATWAELLVCGAHGRPWHRHEVAARLVRLAESASAAVTRALSAPRCPPPDPEGLASYLDQVKKRLRAAD
jgi:hypothetical protein